MTDRRIIHVIRTATGEVMATARGITPEASATWKSSGCEVFAFEIELPIFVAADVVMVSRMVDVSRPA